MADGKTLNGKFSAACPLCGDPNAYCLWVDDAAPEGCAQPFDAKGRIIEVKTVADCHFAMSKAKQQAEFRRMCPEAYDERGNIKPGGMLLVLEKLPNGTTLII